MQNQHISRRHFLAASSSALAGLALGRLPFAAQAVSFTRLQVEDKVLPWLDQPADNPVPQVIANQLALQRGVYTIQQRSNNRFVDAHEIAGKGFALVTRLAQNNDSQKWIISPIGVVCTIQQNNNRFVDAHEIAGKDFALVTRTAQHSDSQKWVLTNLNSNTYTIQQLSNGRFVDAHEIAGKDFALVTRPAQNNNTQRWTISPVGTVCTMKCAPKIGQKRAGAKGEILTAAHATVLQTQPG